MSTLSQFAGGGVKSVQTGYVSLGAGTAGSGEDAAYLDVTITAVSAINKCVVYFQSGYASGVQPLTARLTSTTNLRISHPTASSPIYGRYYVVEYY